ncbi:MAG: nitroreductase family protein [Candidatus Eremiobacteraeota bacterium]|nr:nitroreductase family protein [Candidatus Eremiobacteraeota bacterium]
MDVIDAIKTRRSIRKFKSDPVKRELLEEALESARYSPSWANTQVWEIIVVEDQKIKEALSETLPPGNPSKNSVKEAPVVLAACGKKGASGFYKGAQSTVLGDWLMFDVALFLSTLNLALHAKGLGMVHVGLFDIPEASEILGIPDSVQLVELLPVGFPDQAPSAPKRRESSEFTHWGRY